MTACRSDPCLLYGQRTGEPVNAVVAAQVDDVFGHGDTAFLEMEEKQSTHFECKPRKELHAGDEAFFNGCRISVSKNGTYSVDQSRKLRNLRAPTSQKDLVRVRALVQYNASCIRPDLCAGAQLLSTGVSNPNADAYRRIEKLVCRCQNTSQVGLKFVNLDKESLRLQLFTDASFANANKRKSQLGLVVVLSDKHGRGNIIHYGSTTCKRLARSVMAADLHALVFTDLTMLTRLVRLSPPLWENTLTFIHSSTLELCSSGWQKELTQGKNDFRWTINAIRQIYQTGEMHYFGWIPGDQNVADGLTKGLIDSTHSLWKLMTENRLLITPQDWKCGISVDLESK